MALITFLQAVDQLSLSITRPSDPGGRKLLMEMEEATALALDYIERDADAESPAWTDETDPATDREFAILQAAILIILADLHRFRGDDDEAHGHTSEFDLPPRATRLLRRLKDPAMA